MSPSIQFAFLLAIFVGIQADDFIEGKSQYNKDGDLEISFERLPNMTGNLHSNLMATLFFEEEKLNRQIFNMDICVDFYDKNVTSRKTKKNQRNANVVLCYDGNSEETIAPKNHLSVDDSGRLYNLAKHCGGDPQSKNEKVKNRRGIQLNFEPDKNQGVYTIYSVIDSAIYKININSFEKDEVRVLRQNHVPKFCLRLEMGRMPPDDDELFDQQALVQQLLDGALLEIAANNRSDNLTKLFSEIPQLVLKVDDVKEEFALRTVDLTDAKKEMRVAGQQKRIARNLYGIFENKTAIKNKTMEQMLSKKLYSDFVKKMKTDKNYKTSSKNVLQLELIYGGDNLHFLNFSFNGGNIFPCRTEWVDLQKFQMERDFFHDAIHDEFSPIQIAYTVGLVGWKKEGDRGFGPGYKKKGKFGPAPEDIPDLQLVLNKTEGFTDLDERLKGKFADWDKNINETFTILDEYSIPLQLDNQKPLGLITVKQLVFICSEFTFNLPHVASFTRGSGL